MKSNLKLFSSPMILALLWCSAGALAQETVDDLFGSDATDAAPAEEPAAIEMPTAPAAAEATEPQSADELFGTDIEEPAMLEVPTTAPTGESTEPQSADELFGTDEKSQEPESAPNTTTVTPAPQKSRLFSGITGFWQNELAYTYVGDKHFSKWKNIARLVAKGEFSDQVKWQVSGHLIYDPIFEIDNFYADRVEDNQKFDGYFHETFLSISAGNWEWTVGRQNIVWGESVGLFFADVVSALDLREFVLPDFELIRIPQWAIRSEYYNEDFHAELVYIPIITTEEIGEFGAEYFPFPVTPPPGVNVQFLDEQKPGKFGQDYAAGARASYLKNGWDGALFYYTSPDRSAAFSRELTLAPVPTLTFRGIHERIHQFGATLAKDVGPTIMKAEAVYTKDRLTTVTDPLDFDGLAKTDELRYLIGVDWVVDEHTVNAQFFQTWFQDHRRTMIADEVESGISLLFKTTAIHPDIEPELLWIRSLNRNEWLLEAKVSWKFHPDWRWTLGSDIFEGRRQGFLGRFDNTDRVYSEIRFSF